MTANKVALAPAVGYTREEIFGFVGDRQQHVLRGNAAVGLRDHARLRRPLPIR